MFNNFNKMLKGEGTQILELDRAGFQVFDLPLATS